MARARPTHPLIAQVDSKLEKVRETRGVQQENLASLTAEHRQEVVELNSTKQEKEQKLNELLDNWALENPGKIPALVEKYGREHTENPTQKETMTYLLWNLKAGFGQENVQRQKFAVWLRKFLAQKTSEEWQELLRNGEEEKLAQALTANLVNFSALLAKNPPAKRDFRTLVEWEIREILRKRGFLLANSEPQPYFVATSQSEESGLGKRAERLLKPTLQLFVKDFPVDSGDEETLRAYLRDLFTYSPTEREVRQLSRKINDVYTRLNSGAVTNRLKKLADSPEDLFRIWVSRKLRVLVRLEPGSLRIIEVGGHELYRHRNL